MFFNLLFVDELAARLHPSEVDEVRAMIGERRLELNDDLQRELQSIVEIACEAGSVKSDDLDAVLNCTWSADRVVPSTPRAAVAGAPPAARVLDSLKGKLNVIDIELAAVLTPLRDALDAERDDLHTKIRRVSRLLCGEAVTPPTARRCRPRAMPAAEAAAASVETVLPPGQGTANEELAPPSNATSAKRGDRVRWRVNIGSDLREKHRWFEGTVVRRRDLRKGGELVVLSDDGEERAFDAESGGLELVVNSPSSPRATGSSGASGSSGTSGARRRQSRSRLPSVAVEESAAPSDAPPRGKRKRQRRQDAILPSLS